MKTVLLQLRSDYLIFQQGLTLALEDRIADNAYRLPDDGTGNAARLPVELTQPAETPTGEDNGAYYGKCVLTRVSNFYPGATKPDAVGIGEIGVVETRDVQFVHYPDCQQLSFHLPKYAYDAGALRLTDAVTGNVLADLAVRDKLNGSTQILWDTLPIPPGFYTLEADWPDGWTHRIQFIKFIDGFPQDRTYQSPPGNLTMVQNDREYRLFDANKVEMPDVAAQLREQLASGTGRRVEYTQEGRAGNIIYRDGPLRLDFDWEFAGGNALILILVPTEQQWEAATGRPLEERAEILNFVAEQTLRDKAPGYRYEMDYNTISILR